MVKGIVKILVSIRLTVTTLLILILCLFLGAYLMPLKEEFQSIHSWPLIEWLTKMPIDLTWWLWASIILLILLTINTIFCSIDSIIKKRRLTGWLILISPQIIHVGFLFILFAHLMSSLGGFKDYSVVTEGTIINISPDEFIRFERINIETDQRGFITDWSIDTGKFNNGIYEDISIRPNRPLFTKGVGIYIRDIQTHPFKAALMEISREPGAIWALFGAMLFATGTIILLILRLRRYTPQ